MLREALVFLEKNARMWGQIFFCKKQYFNSTVVQLYLICMLAKGEA